MVLASLGGIPRGVMQIAPAGVVVGRRGVVVGIGALVAVREGAAHRLSL